VHNHVPVILQPKFYDETARVFARLTPLVQARCPFRVKPKTNEPATCIRPELVCEVRFTAWTGGHLRHPIFVGMRGDQSRLRR
jgi:bifunctional non-homologous end joining protein LigD